MKGKKVVGIVAVLAAIAGAAVAVGLFLKKIGKKVQEDLDFDDSIYFEEEPGTDFPEDEASDFSAPDEEDAAAEE